MKTVRKSDGHVLSVLSIKSAIVDDSGNYSCVHAETNHSDTIRLIVVDGEHSAAIYKSAAAGDASGVIASKAADTPGTDIVFIAVVALAATFRSSS